MSSTAATAEAHSKTVRDALARNVVFDMGATIGYLVSRFFIPPFVIAHIGLQAYGLWATAFIIVSYVGVSTIGVSAVYVKFVAEYAAKNEPQRANHLLSTGVFFTATTSLGLFALLWWLCPHLVSWLNVPPALEEDARFVLMVVVGVFLADLSFSAFQDVLSGVQRLATVKVIWVISYLSETALIFLLVGLGRGVRGLAEAFFVRTVLSILLSAGVAFRSVPWLELHPKHFNWQSLKTIFSFGGIVQIQGLIAIFLNSIEKALAAPLIGLQAVGLLDVGKKLPAMAASVPSSFASAFMPAASYLQGGLEGGGEARETLGKLYLKGARYMNLCAAYLCGFLATSPAAFLGVWLGQEFPGATLLMVVFCISTQVHLLTGPGTSIFKGLGRLREEFFYCLPNLALLAIAIPASRLLVGGWTATGIACAVGASTLISAAIFITRANRILTIPAARYFSRVVLPGLLPYLIGLALTYPIALLVNDSSRFVGAAVVVGAGILYTALFAVVVDRLVFDREERQWFHALVANKIQSLRGKGGSHAEP